MVEIRSIQGFPVSFEGDSYMLLEDRSRGRMSRPESESILESGVSERGEAVLI